MKFAKSLLNTLPLLIIFISLLGYNYILASDSFVKPLAGSIAPDNNASNTVNVGSKNQDKQGSLSASALVSDSAKAISQMWSPKYCDQNGENCLGEDSPSIFNSEVQYFESYVTNGGSSQTTSLGNWTMCILGRQTSRADDNNIQDSCFVEQTSPGYWKLTLQKHPEDSLRCGAQCFYLGVNRDTAPAVTNYTYAWNVGMIYSCTKISSDGCFGSKTPGTGLRSVVCKRSDGSTVSDSFCPRPKPATVASCDAYCSGN